MQGADSSSFHESRFLLEFLFKAAVQRVAIFSRITSKCLEISAPATSQGIKCFESSPSVGEELFGVRGLQCFLSDCSYILFVKRRWRIKSTNAFRPAATTSLLCPKLAVSWRRGGLDGNISTKGWFFEWSHFCQKNARSHSRHLMGNAFLRLRLFFALAYSEASLSLQFVWSLVMSSSPPATDLLFSRSQNWTISAEHYNWNNVADCSVLRTHLRGTFVLSTKVSILFINTQ